MYGRLQSSRRNVLVSGRGGERGSRTIKPEFWSHLVMARLDAPTQLVALALLNYADDGGYFYAKPVLVAGLCAV